LTMRIPFSSDRKPDNRFAFAQEVLNRIGSVPGVKAASINTGLPPIGNGSTPVEVIGGPPRDERPVVLHQTTDKYADAMSLTLVQGRFLSEQDVAGKMRSVVVNQAFAQRYLSGQNPLGRLIRIQRFRTSTTEPFQVVGIVKDRVNRIFTRETLPEMYVPYSIAAVADRLVISCTGVPAALERGLRAQVYAVDRTQPVMDVWTMEEALGRYIYARPRFNLILFTIFAALGLTLALFGVYGVISHAVAQRTREIGIRIALGASLGEVVGMMLRGGAKLLGAGIAVGLGGSLASVKTLSGLVTNVSTFDAYSFLAVTLVLFAAGLFASYWPARRAAKIDPLDALRNE